MAAFTFNCKNPAYNNAIKLRKERPAYEGLIGFNSGFDTETVWGPEGNFKIKTC